MASSPCFPAFLSTNSDHKVIAALYDDTTLCIFGSDHVFYTFEAFEIEVWNYRPELFCMLETANQIKIIQNFAAMRLWQHPSDYSSNEALAVKIIPPSTVAQENNRENNYTLEQEERWDGALEYNWQICNQISSSLPPFPEVKFVV
ncbi:hypothetical protein VNO80_21234 [Phaseolus coccineus]|uniref:Uncharacterized protein n=1 Tax=Phaseolus coccineus TaxID=3886 RepID=A0AAN9M2P2_PHACN